MLSSKGNVWRRPKAEERRTRRGGGGETDGDETVRGERENLKTTRDPHELIFRRTAWAVRLNAVNIAETDAPISGMSERTSITVDDLRHK